MNKLLSVSPALNHLPFFAKRFIQRNELAIPFFIPIRTNGLTGSGKDAKCHANSYALARRFGGEAINGYSISLYESQGKVHTVFLTDHTVWKTPENKLVDVTAHNFSYRSHHIFAPISPLIKKQYVFPSVTLTHDYLKKGVSIDFRDPIINSNVRDIMNAKETIHSPSKSVLLIPSSRINPNFFRLYHTQIDNEYLSDLDKMADFSNPSCATGKSWSEMRAS